MEAIISENSAVLTQGDSAESDLLETVEQVLNLMEKVSDPMHFASQNFSILDNLIVKLEREIFLASRAVQLSFNRMVDQHRLADINLAYCAWETYLEKFFVDDFMSGKASCFRDYRLTQRFKRLLSREVSMLKQDNIKKALFIGSGPFPISAIWLNRLLGVPVDCLDVDAEAIETSGLFLNKADLLSDLTLRYEPTAEYDVSQYDTIIIALLAKPKKQILENISRTMKPDCQVICRTSKGLRNILYEPTRVTRQELGDFYTREERIVDGVCDDTISSVLLGNRNA